MSSITVQIDEIRKSLLEEVAKSQNTTIDELVSEAIDSYLKEKEERFQSAREYVRKRYHELYKKLA